MRTIFAALTLGCALLVANAAYTDASAAQRSAKARRAGGAGMAGMMGMMSGIMAPDALSSLTGNTVPASGVAQGSFGQGGAAGFPSAIGRTGLPY